MNIALHAVDNVDYSSLVNPVGLWSVTPTGLGSVTSVNLNIRYDSLASGSNEPGLELWSNTGSGWQQVTSGFSIDTGNHLISADYTGSLASTTEFAVATDAAPGAFSGLANWTSNSRRRRQPGWQLDRRPGQQRRARRRARPLNTARAYFDGTGTQTAVNLTNANPSLRVVTFSNLNYTLSGGSLTLGQHSGPGHADRQQRHADHRQHAEPGQHGQRRATHAADVLNLFGPIVGGNPLQVYGAGTIVQSNVSSSPVTMNGTGTLVLSGTNTSAGGTQLNAGVVSVANDIALGDPPPAR